MAKRGIAVAAALLAFCIALAALLAGQPWLGKPALLFGIPAGNLLAWLLMFSLPLAAWLLLPTGRLRRANLLPVLMGACWLPVSIVLAGNIYLNYMGGWRLGLWLAYSGVNLGMPLLLLLIWGTAWCVARIRASQT
ncbi:MAG: hypothetical protein ACNA8J_12415 [Gammaproteobacteria bacterium]